MMINVFYKNRNTIGQFMVALIFLGTFGFLFTYDRFVSKSQAGSCCSGGEAAVTSFAADSSGDFGSDTPMDASSINGCCSGLDKLIPSSTNNGDDPCDCLFLPGSSEDRECGDCPDGSTCEGDDMAKCNENCDCSKDCCGYGTKCSGSLCDGKDCG